MEWQLLGFIYINFCIVLTSSFVLMKITQNYSIELKSRLQEFELLMWYRRESYHTCNNLTTSDIRTHTHARTRTRFSCGNTEKMHAKYRYAYLMYANSPLHVSPIQPHGQIQMHKTVSSVPPFLHGPQIFAETHATNTRIKKSETLRNAITLAA